MMGVEQEYMPSVDTSPGNFICSFCPAKTRTWKGLLKHTLEEHRDEARGRR